jgi:hypothetical protein
MWGPSATCFDKIDDSSAFVADDDIAIGSVADRRLLSGAKQTFHFKGVRTVFDPERTSHDPWLMRLPSI